jgi:hypothetical protein
MGGEKLVYSSPQSSTPLAVDDAHALQTSRHHVIQVFIKV